MILLILIIFAVVVAIGYFGTALFIGMIGAMFFDHAWRYGYHEALDHPWRLILVMVVLGPFFFGAGSSARK